MSKFQLDPLEIALATEALNASDARRANVRRTFDTRTGDLPPIQGAKAGDRFNKSLDLDVLDQPSKSAPEPADVEPWQQPLAATKAGIHNGALVYQGSGMISNATSAGTGKVNPSQEPLAMTKGPRTAEEIAQIKRVQMRQP